MNKSQIILLRHGETEWNKLNIIQGHLDSPLSDAGVYQTKLLAERLSIQTVDFIYSSDLGRAKATAGIIATRCKKPVNFDSNLREKNHGLIEGLSWEAVEQQYPEVYSALRGAERDPAYRPLNGESDLEFQERIVTAVTNIFRKHESSVILIVTHGGAVDAFARHVLGLPFSIPRRYSLKNLAITRFVIKRGNLFVDTLGDTSHLDERFHGSKKTTIEASAATDSIEVA